uniref:Uncharacterized protein n=1 Tax=Quercus lobata TaxID=97700 RepID=A0A7N2M7N4_QUELO
MNYNVILLSIRRGNKGSLISVLNENLYLSGIKYTSASFGSATDNTLPAINLFIAVCILRGLRFIFWIDRLENIDIKHIRSQAKAFGAIAAVAGVMLMTLVKGPTFMFPWTKEEVTKNLNEALQIINI